MERRTGIHEPDSDAIRTETLRAKERERDRGTGGKKKKKKKWVCIEKNRLTVPT